jgi:hypothetical protein
LEQDHKSNRDPTSALRFAVAASLPATFTARHIVGDFEDVGTITISGEHAVQSLDPDLSQ